MLYTLIYVSSAVNKFAESELFGLLNLARSENKKTDITGVLLYNDGNFLQVIEGEKNNIEDLFKKIEKDPRHKGIIKIFEDQINKRRFGDWSMGFLRHKHSDLKLIKGFMDLSEKSFAFESFENDHDDAAILVRSFKELMLNVKK